MTEYLLSIDPGKSTGIALLAYTDKSVTLDWAWQFEGGAWGLKDWIEENWRDYDYDSEWMSEHAAGLRHPAKRWPILAAQEIVEDRYDPDLDDDVAVVTEKKVLTVIAEKFTARDTRGFSYTTDSLEPLRCEGVLLALGLMPDYTATEKRWRDPGLQYLVGGKDRATKKKRQHKFLKDSGFYMTGGDLGAPDADDYRSACAHWIAYLAREARNKAAFKLITDWTEANG